MKIRQQDRLRILSLLSENLSNPQPQVVNIETIAAALKLSLKDTRQLLLRMDQDGEIQSDIDGNFSLITPAGLLSLTGARVGANA